MHRQKSRETASEAASEADSEADRRMYTQRERRACRELCTMTERQCWQVNMFSYRQ